MQVVLLASIKVLKRQRSEVPTSHINSLCDSILNVGLLHAPVCWKDGDRWVLTVGECRLRAIQELAKENRSFRHAGIQIDPGFIPITPLSEAVESLAFEAELDENVRRLDLTWQDKARAYSDLHTMRLASNPKQTLAETKAELVNLNAPSLHTGAPLRAASTNANEVREAQVIAENLNRPEIANARNAREALALVYRREEERIRAVLAKRSLAEAPKQSDHLLYLGDMKDTLPTIADGTIDLIIADPPYGIQASAGGFRGRTVIHHNYEDTPEIAKDLIQTILTEGFRLTKPMANIFIFCDIDNFPLLKTIAANLGWVPFRRPLIWRKSESEGMAPWGGSGPRITTEFIFWATKGQRGMIASPLDVFDFSRVPRNLRTHGAEKPVELLKALIECTTLPGDSVLDPCCGSGSTLVAAKDLKRSAIGIEKDATYHTTAFANLFGQKDDSNGKEITP